MARASHGRGSSLTLGRNYRERRIRPEIQAQRDSDSRHRHGLPAEATVDRISCRHRSVSRPREYRHVCRADDSERRREARALASRRFAGMAGLLALRCMDDHILRQRWSADCRQVSVDSNRRSAR